jgi:hypothetical protein
MPLTIAEALIAKNGNRDGNNNMTRSTGVKRFCFNSYCDAIVTEKSALQSEKQHWLSVSTDDEIPVDCDLQSDK